jgi:hypothetical protein
MYRKKFKQILCLTLIFLQPGCSSVYKLNLYTMPSGAIVQTGSKVWGETPCTLELPQDSDLIAGHRIDVTYLLPDGHSATKTYDLSKYRPANQFVADIAATIALPGAAIFLIAESDGENDDSGQDNAKLVGLGLIGLGVLVLYAFGGVSSYPDGLDIVEKFSDVNDVPVK